MGQIWLMLNCMTFECESIQHNEMSTKAEGGAKAERQPRASLPPQRRVERPRKAASTLAENLGCEGNAASMLSWRSSVSH